MDEWTRDRVNHEAQYYGVAWDTPSQNSALERRWNGRREVRAGGDDECGHDKRRTRMWAVEGDWGTRRTTATCSALSTVGEQERSASAGRWGGASRLPQRVLVGERGSRGTRRGGLTYGGDDEENEECVEHGHDGGGERRHDVAERAHAAEEADDAEGAQRPDRVDRHADGPQSHERQQDDDAVEDIPAVLQEGVEPVGVGVDDELDGEDEGEEHVHALQADAGGGEAAVAVCERVGELRLCCVYEKVLRPASSIFKTNSEWKSWKSKRSGGRQTVLYQYRAQLCYIVFKD